MGDDDHVGHRKGLLLYGDADSWRDSFLHSAILDDCEEIVSGVRVGAADSLKSYPKIGEVAGDKFARVGGSALAGRQPSIGQIHNHPYRPCLEQHYNADDVGARWMIDEIRAVEDSVCLQNDPCL